MHSIAPHVLLAKKYQHIKNMSKKYQVLSPDGFAISHMHPYYTSLKKAKEALAQWVQSYAHQGYYSQTCYNGYKREISLAELPDYCEIIAL